jgi:hypothetical protein
MVETTTAAENVFGSDAEELNTLFGMTEDKRAKIAGIKNRVKMPDPTKKGDTVTVVVRYYKTKDGKVNYYKKVTGAKFKTPAIFLNVEEVEAPGIEKDLQMPKTLFQSVDRELSNRGLTITDLPGKVMTITADYWTSAPRSKRSNPCPKCKGKGCDFCVVSGSGQDAGVATGLCPPTRYDAVFRDDIMSGKTAVAGKKAVF